MKMGRWIKPPGGKIKHFMLTPRAPQLAMRHSVCGRTFLIGADDRQSRAKKCGNCSRAS